MNEQIRLLVEQATTRIDPIAHDGACWNFDKEKFAELIVVACGEFCGQVDRDAMFKYFGVEP